MSALFGVWNFDGRPAAEESLQRAASLPALQGRDGQTIYAKDNFGLVYSPFRPTRESHREVQPHVTRSNLVVGWDGRLDNRDELTNDLAGQLSPDAADVALAATGFENWGTRAFAKFLGDWALSVWNPAEKTLFLAKDYMGVRHLYYALSAGRVLWSTHLDPLVLLSSSCLSVDDEYIAGYLANFPPAHLTPYRQIQAVPPGHFVVIRNGTATHNRHWSFEPKRRIHYKTDAQYEDHFRHLFRQSVRRRLRSDSPILAELSGGIDSSSIVCMADDIIDKGEADTVRLDTLSAFDAKEPCGDEQRYFARIEEKRGRVGHHLNREEYENVFDLNCSDPVVAPGLSECTGKLKEDLLNVVHSHGYCAVLSGIGGDEFLGGVPNPLPQLADLIVLPRPIRLMKQLTAWSLIKKRPCIQLLGQTLATLLPARLRAMASVQSNVAPWINSGFSRRYRLAVRQLGPLGAYRFWLPSRRDFAQTVVAMARQMAYFPTHGVAREEIRYPYLDQSLVEFLLAIPATQLLRPGQRRSLMRRALTGIVPAEILFRKTKGFVTRRVLGAFENSWPELEALFNSPISADLGYLDPHRFLDSLRAAKNGDAHHMMYLLKTLYLELWLRSLAGHGILGTSSTSQGITRQPLFHPGV